MGTYEVLCILPVNLAEAEVTSTIDEFRGMAETAGATTVTEDAWGRRRLAYPINKQPEGIYHLYIFEAEPGSLDDLDRRMRNSDNIMRHMIVRTDLETRRAKKKGVYREPGTEAEAVETAPEAESPKQKTELSAAEAVERKESAPEDAPIKSEAKPVEPESDEANDSDAEGEEE